MYNVHVGHAFASAFRGQCATGATREDAPPPLRLSGLCAVLANAYGAPLCATSTVTADTWTLTLMPTAPVAALPMPTRFVFDAAAFFNASMLPLAHDTRGVNAFSLDLGFKIVLVRSFAAGAHTRAWLRAVPLRDPSERNMSTASMHVGAGTEVSITLSSNLNSDSITPWFGRVKLPMTSLAARYVVQRTRERIVAMPCVRVWVVLAARGVVLPRAFGGTHMYCVAVLRRQFFSFSARRHMVGQPAQCSLLILPPIPCFWGWRCARVVAIAQRV